MTNARLYILMRSDMASMNPGKAMAQASHASNAFVHYSKKINFDISSWENQTDQGFGTVIVLDGTSIECIEKTINMLNEVSVMCGLVLDPTYPLMDGDYLHLIPVNTCAWVYMKEDEEDLVKIFLENYKLHA